MSERARNRIEQNLSITQEFGETRARKNFIDPILLEAAKDTYASAAGVLAVGAGFGLAGAGIGIGTYFHQKGEAEKIRAEKELPAQASRVKTGSRPQSERSSEH